MSHLAILTGLSIAMASGTECPTRYGSADVDARLGEAEHAFAQLQVDGFRTSRDRASLLLLCLEEVIRPEVAGRFHLIRGIDLFIAGDLAGAEEAFAAARAADPSAEFPDIVPAGHSIRSTFAMIDTSSPVYQDLPAPVSGTLAIDGAAGRQRATGWPTIIQVTDEQGSVVWTAYLRPEHDVPHYEAVQPDLPVSVEAPSSRMAWLPVGGGVIVVGGATVAALGYGQATSAAKALERVPENQAWATYEDGEASYASGSRMYHAGLVLGAVGAVTVGAGLFLGADLAVTPDSVNVDLRW